MISKRILAVKGGRGFPEIPLTDHQRDSFKNFSDSFYLLEREVNNASEVV